MKKSVIGVIVLGGHIQGYGIIRILGENGIPSIIIDKNKINISRFSKYCIESFSCDYNNIVAFLNNLGQSERYKEWILIPTDDYYVKILSENKVQLEKYFQVSVDVWDKIEIFYNKKYTYPLAEKTGIPIPKTFYPQNIEDIKIIGNSVDYPCIIKPAIMLDFYRNFKQKVFICNNLADLVENAKKANEISEFNNLLIQEIIPGGSENQYSVGVFYDKDKIYNHIVAKRLRQHPIDFGNATTFAETVKVDVLVDYADRILKAVEFTGVCEVEFKYDNRDNSYKFLEVNARTWKWHLLMEAANIPLLLSLYNFMTSGKSLIKNNYNDACWHDIIADVPIILKLLIKNKYVKPQGYKQISAVFNLKDLMPFVAQVCLLPYFLIKR